MDVAERDVKDLVVFDFDGTLTTEDTFVLFMKHYCGTFRWYLKMVPLLGVFARYKLGRIDRHAVKHAVVKAVFAGVPFANVQAEADRFAREDIPGLIRPKGLETFREKVAAMNNGGPQVIICSASISPYLEAFFRGELAVDIVSCELEVDSRGTCTGKLRTRNVWGDNKLEAIRERFHSYRVNLRESYGDTAGDRAILDAAQTAYWRPFRV